jgi:prophage regulatory protein
MFYRFIKLRNVKAAVGEGTTAVYQDVKDELLTPPIKKGRSSFWIEQEIAAINAARVAGRSDEEIRALVRDLVAERGQAISHLASAYGAATSQAAA